MSTHKKPPSLEVCILVEDGDVIVQIFDSLTRANCTLTVRNPATEQKTTVTMNDWQAAALAELLQRVPAEDE